MNHFERVAIFTLVDNIENQLKGLKTLIAASANVTTPTEHKVTTTLETDSHELSESDEDMLAQGLEIARKANIERMSKTAETHFQQEWDLTSQGMSALDG